MRSPLKNFRLRDNRFVRYGDHSVELRRQGYARRAGGREARMLWRCATARCRFCQWADESRSGRRQRPFFR
jgi:hypothetical protein